MATCCTKRQVLAYFAPYAVVRSVLDELCPADDLSSASAAYDQVAFDAVSTAIEAKVIAKGGN